jgi:predicted protein tyrosine phosphatase
MYVINEWLATHGLDFRIGNIKDEDTGEVIEGFLDDSVLQPNGNGMINGFKAFDIREKMKDAPNPVHVYKNLAEEAVDLLNKHGKLVVCCSAGRSRSNSIAIAVLMRYAEMSFDDAYRLVKQKVPIADPLPWHLERIKELAEY